MQHQNIKSSTIDAFEYDPAAKRLDVTFKSGGTYSYNDVPPETYLDFCQAESHGKHFAAHVRGKYSTVKHEKKD